MLMFHLKRFQFCGIVTRMKINDAGLELIKSFEQCRLYTHLPTSHDVPTIGWGHTGTDVKPGMTITQSKADELLAQDVKRFEDGVRAAIGNSPTTPNQFAAMVSLAYNIGMGRAQTDKKQGVPGFRTSSVLTKGKNDLDLRGLLSTQYKRGLWEEI